VHGIYVGLEVRAAGAANDARAVVLSGRAAERSRGTSFAAKKSGLLRTAADLMNLIATNDSNR
jgi:hypothetical protein